MSERKVKKSESNRIDWFDIQIHIGCNLQCVWLVDYIFSWKTKSFRRSNQKWMQPTEIDRKKIACLMLLSRNCCLALHVIHLNVSQPHFGRTRTHVTNRFSNDRTFYRHHASIEFIFILFVFVCVYFFFHVHSVNARNDVCFFRTHSRSPEIRNFSFNGIMFW